MTMNSILLKTGWTVVISTLFLVVPMHGLAVAQKAADTTGANHVDLVDPISADVLQRVIDSEIQAAKQVDLLYRQVQKLIDRQQQFLKDKANREAMDESTEQTTLMSDQTDHIQINQRELANTTEKPNVDGSTPEALSTIGSTASVSNEDIAANLESANKILSQPPDQMALADSLVLSGNFDLALDIYRRITLTPQIRHDQLWTEYQIASCLRRLGRIDEASKKYREIANLEHASEIVETSKWWLDHIVKKQQIQNDSQIMRNILKISSRANHEYK